MQNDKEILEPDFYYHIYNRANGFEKMFKNDGNYKFFLQKYSFYINPIADTFAYCLMPTHFHFLVRIKSSAILSSLKGFKIFKDKHLPGFKNLAGVETSITSVSKTHQGFKSLGGLENKFLSKQFSNLFNSYTQAFNNQNNRHGSLFQKPFNRKKITSEEYLKNAINYIHQNPISHGYTEKLNDWEFSSYSAFIDNKPTQIQKQEVFDLFDDKDNFVFYHNLKTAEKYAEEMEINY